MPPKIDTDHGRFRKIVKGHVRKNLKKYISRGELIGKVGKNRVRIPVSQLQLPRFQYGGKKSGGVGQGEGKEGDPLGPAPGQDGGGEAGDKPGEHDLEVDVSLEELAKILGEELELPKIEPKGKSKIYTEIYRYSGIRNVGPESLRHFKRTFKQALKRQIASGFYNPEKPVVIPMREDRRYRSWKVTNKPESNAVIIYMMDVSGSMGDEQKEMVRIESFWIDTWLRSQYDGIESRYIIHDAEAREVDRHTFFHTRESGGTMISSAYFLCKDIMEKDYPPDEWNIYPFHFSDGDNWSADDTQRCIKVLQEKILPACNQFGYGQVRSPYGSGKFIEDLQENFKDDDKLVTSRIDEREMIAQSIKDFLGKGR
ncbi:MAG: DUF444 family protein [Deltaproteobacteria bacterium]|nr:DUF444 family protein [Deltaproteobacteria bacterium]